MFKANNKDTRITLYLTPSIDNFEQVNVSWVKATKPFGRQKSKKNMIKVTDHSFPKSL